MFLKCFYHGKFQTLTKVSTKNYNEMLCTYYPASTVTSRQLNFCHLFSRHLLLSSHTLNYFEADPREIMIYLQLVICMIFNHLINSIFGCVNIWLYFS